MLCTVFLAEEMSVRKTVTTLVAKTLQECNAHWRTRVYERSSKVSGFLLRARPDLSVHYRVTSRSSHYQAGCGRPALEHRGKRFPPNPIRSTAGSGQGQLRHHYPWYRVSPSGISTKFSAQAVTKIRTSLRKRCMLSIVIAQYA